MVGFNVQHGPLIRDHYRRVIHEIMEERGIIPWTTRPSGGHIVHEGTTLGRVVQHTDSYTAGRHDARPHFRYDPYIELLRQRIQLSARRIAHIDIGCGAGLFSWVLLDWATENGFNHDHIDLYGLDHCPAMIDLASEIRMRMMRTVPMPNYPSLHYDYDSDSFLRRLKMAWHPNTQYIVTFGHVLVQSYDFTQSSIQYFAHIIDRIMEFRGADATCEIIADDATTGTWHNSFIEAWTLLSDSLTVSYMRRQIGGPGPPMYAFMDEVPPRSVNILR